MNAGARTRALRARALAGVCVLGCAMVFVAGCETQERVVRYRPFFAGLPNAEGAALSEATGGGAPRARRAKPVEIDVTNPDGTRTLVARTGRHLMIHVYNTLAKNEKDLFTQQVLSEKTKREFREQGLDPGEAFDRLKAREEDIISLFNAMPFGENTPGLLLEPQGMRVQRMRLRGLDARGLRYVGMDMIMEGGNWRLRWFVPASAE